MKKMLNKCLRIPGMIFYLTDNKILPEYGNLTKIKTKKRLKELVKSNKFIYDVKIITVNHDTNKCFIYLNKEII